MTICAIRVESLSVALITLSQGSFPMGTAWVVCVQQHTAAKQKHVRKSHILKMVSQVKEDIN